MSKDYIFKEDWQTHHIPNWLRTIKPIMDRVFNPKYLELGTFEGRSVLWVLDILLHRSGLEPKALATCIDHWKTPSIMQRFLHNVENSKHEDRIRVINSDWREALLKIGEFDLGEFHLIYIDADHRAQSVLSQACICWEFLADYGVMVFDDYAWHPRSGCREQPPGPGIDDFMKHYRGHYKVLHHDYQVILQKIPYVS